MLTLHFVGMTDESKVTKAKEIAVDFRKKIRECDDAASNNNFNKIIENYQVTSKEMNDFIDLMNDVPDEL